MFLWRKNISIIVYVNDYSFTNVMDNMKLTKKYLQIFLRNPRYKPLSKHLKIKKLKCGLMKYCYFSVTALKIQNKDFMKELIPIHSAIHKVEWNKTVPCITHEYIVQALY